MITYSDNTGSRVHTLRLRYGLTTIELAKRSGLDVSYLSRLERGVLQNARAKPQTVERVLDALQATLEEREAVRHVERPPLSRAAIAAQVREIAAQYEEHAEPFTLRDDRWHVWYYNRTARAILGYNPEEYACCMGAHMLHEVIDPAIPRYSRTPDEDRAAVFSMRAKTFKVHFAGEEFDQWYLDIVSVLKDFPWAAKLWDHPVLDSDPVVLDRQEITIAWPSQEKLRFAIQFNRLMANPRMVLITWTPLDRVTKQRIAQAKAQYEFGYSGVELLHGMMGPLLCETG